MWAVNIINCGIVFGVSFKNYVRNINWNFAVQAFDDAWRNRAFRGHTNSILGFG